MSTRNRANAPEISGDELIEPKELWSTKSNGVRAEENKYEKRDGKMLSSCRVDKGSSKKRNGKVSVVNGDNRWRNSNSTYFEHTHTKGTNVSIVDR